MVNVGGRSKGCSTCRRRKVKCDETRPVCKRCQKSDLVCDGAKDITFIEAKIVKSRRSEKQPTISREHETKELDSGGRQILSPISQRGNETEIYLCYALRHLVRGGAIDLALRTSRSNELVEAGKTSASSEIFHQAVLSFAIIFFGTRHRQSSITNDGYVQLGGTLKQLNQALSEPDCYTRDEIILSVIALALLESLAPTGPDHYLQHMLGLERLIELRGPSAYCSPKTSQFFRGVRYMILFAALRTRRPSMLARPEWKKILRANCSQQTEQEEDLFDVIADCTVLLSDCNRVATVVGGDRENQLERDRIARRTLILLTFLDDWRERWSSDVVNSYAHILPEHQARNSETEESLFPLTVFEFSNDFSATMLIFYNTALIYVLQILTSLTSKNPDIEPSRRSTNTICRDTADTLYDLRKQINNEHITAKRSAALEICSCLPYLIRKSYLGSRVVHLAVTTAWSALGGNRTAEGRWIRNILSAGDREFIAKGLWADDIASTQDFDRHCNVSGFANAC